MTPQEIPKAILQARASLNKRMQKAYEAVQKAGKGLKAAIDVYNRKHNEATRRNRPVPSAAHEKLVNGITKARTKLASKLEKLMEVESEWKEYFREV